MIFGSLTLITSALVASASLKGYEYYLNSDSEKKTQELKSQKLQERLQAAQIQILNALEQNKELRDDTTQKQTEQQQSKTLIPSPSIEDIKNE